MHALAEITTFNGLPAHPLVVHLPVMLVPLALIGAVMALARAPWRSWALPITAVMAGGALVGVQLAIMSGEGLEEISGEKEALIERHSQLAEQARPMVLAFFLVAAAAAVVFFLVNKDAEGPSPRTAKLARALVPLCALSVLFGGLSTVWVYRTGHTGAESVWKDEGKKSSDQGGDKGATTTDGDQQQAPAGDGDTDGD